MNCTNWSNFGNRYTLTFIIHHDPYHAIKLEVSFESSLRDLGQPVWRKETALLYIRLMMWGKNGTTKEPKHNTKKCERSYIVCLYLQSLVLVVSIRAPIQHIQLRNCPIISRYQRVNSSFPSPRSWNHYWELQKKTTFHCRISGYSILLGSRFLLVTNHGELYWISGNRIGCVSTMWRRLKPDRLQDYSAVEQLACPRAQTSRITIWFHSMSSRPRHTQGHMP